MLRPGSAPRPSSSRHFQHESQQQSPIQLHELGDDALYFRRRWMETAASLQQLRASLPSRAAQTHQALLAERDRLKLGVQELQRDRNRLRLQLRQSSAPEPPSQQQQQQQQQPEDGERAGPTQEAEPQDVGTTGRKSANVYDRLFSRAARGQKPGHEAGNGAQENDENCEKPAADPSALAAVRCR